MSVPSGVDRARSWLCINHCLSQSGGGNMYAPSRRKSRKRFDDSMRLTTSSQTLELPPWLPCMSCANQAQSVAMRSCGEVGCYSSDRCGDGLSTAACEQPRLICTTRRGRLNTSCHAYIPDGRNSPAVHCSVTFHSRCACSGKALIGCTASTSTMARRTQSIAIGRSACASIDA